MSKYRMKKAIGVFVAASMLFLCLVPAAAAPKKEAANPVLLIAGFSEYALTDSNGENVFAPSTGQILTAVQGCLSPLGALVTGDYASFCAGAIPVVNTQFGPVACNPDGTVADDSVGIYAQFTEAVSHYKLEDVMAGDAFDRDIVKAVIDEVGADKVYVYGIDWRRPLTDVADDINAYVEKMKADTGASRVSIAGHSMGGAALAAYISEYGYEDVSNILMLNSAFTGLEMVGQLFTGNVQINADSLLNLITENIGTDILSKVLGATQILNRAIPVLEDFLKAENEAGGTYKDTLFAQCLVPSFGYTPGIWAFVPAGYYTEAKAFMKGQMEAHQAQVLGLSEAEIAANWAVFEETIDAYHNVQANIKETLAAAKSNGVCVAVTAGYNLTVAPVTPAYAMTGDGTIETIHTSGFATCAEQGSVLGENYKQAIASEKNRISADCMIDASTCFFPENTWFIKNYQHANFDYTENGCELYVRLLTADRQVTVETWAEYPQFMVYNSKTHLVTPLNARLGDLDFDGALTPVDARLALRHAKTMQTLSAAAQSVADLDADKQITGEDARLILERYAGVS